MADTQLVLLVTGSRTWDDVWTLKHHLDLAAAEAAEHGLQHETTVELIVRHGACYPTEVRGQRPHTSADWLAHRWIQRFAGDLARPAPTGLVAITEQERPAHWEAPCRDTCRTDWDGHRRIRRGRSVCSAAGQYRNEAMIAEQPRPDIVLAFLRDKSTGTSGCIKTARAAGIQPTVVPYEPEDRAVAALTAGGLNPERITP